MCLRQGSIFAQCPEAKLMYWLQIPYQEGCCYNITLQYNRSNNCLCSYMYTKQELYDDSQRSILCVIVSYKLTKIFVDVITDLLGLVDQRPTVLLVSLHRWLWPPWNYDGWWPPYGPATDSANFQPEQRWKSYLIVVTVLELPRYNSQIIGVYSVYIQTGQVSL